MEAWAMAMVAQAVAVAVAMVAMVMAAAAQVFPDQELKYVFKNSNFRTKYLK